MHPQHTDRNNSTARWPTTVMFGLPKPRRIPGLHLQQRGRADQLRHVDDGHGASTNGTLV
eukprot:2842211-Prymnesium_polylepis.1